MAETEYQSRSQPGEITPPQRKAITYCSIALLGAVMGFMGGMSYQQWLSQPISAIEQKLNEDEIPDVSVLDRELNRTDYIGTSRGMYKIRLPATPASPDGLK